MLTMEITPEKNPASDARVLVIDGVDVLTETTAPEEEEPEGSESGEVEEEEETPEASESAEEEPEASESAQ